MESFMTPTPTNISRSITITFQLEGIHRYPAAGTDPNLQDVSFLAHPHRHIFHFDVSVDVQHNDRDIEYIQFKRWCQSLYKSDGPLDVDYKSCEMLAEDLVDCIKQQYTDRRYVSVSVSEDKENMATITKRW